MGIHDLLALMPPPSDPFEKGSGVSVSEESLGVSLPADYIAFGTHYGTGEIFDPCGLTLTILNPFSATYREDVLSECLRLQQTKARYETTDDPMPYDIYPIVPGLFPWGRDDNGFGFYWLTGGASDQWPIMVKPPREHLYFQRFDLTMTSFLAKSFRREIECVAWSDAPFFSRPKEIRFVT